MLTASGPCRGGWTDGGSLHYYVCKDCNCCCLGRGWQAMTTTSFCPLYTPSCLTSTATLRRTPSTCHHTAACSTATSGPWPPSSHLLVHHQHARLTEPRAHHHGWKPLTVTSLRRSAPLHMLSSVCALASSGARGSSSPPCCASARCAGAPPPRHSSTACNHWATSKSLVRRGSSSNSSSNRQAPPDTSMSC